MLVLGLTETVLAERCFLDGNKGYILILIEISRLQLDLTSDGFTSFISEFKPLKEPLTVTIALLSTYFILFQDHHRFLFSVPIYPSSDLVETSFQD